MFRVELIRLTHWWKLTMWISDARLGQIVSLVIAIAVAGGSRLHAAEYLPPLRALPSDLAARAATFAADLSFPDQAEAPSALTRPRPALLKPSGDGPFPALVMVHQCAGLNPAVAQWAREAVGRGFVVLLIDSLMPRNISTVCNGPQAGVNLFRGAKDSFQAAAHLRSLSFVDASRVSFVGFSWGGMIGLVVASARYADALGGRPFASVTSFYPGCFRILRSNASVFDIVSDDMKQPVLVLMGDADNETPAAECVVKLRDAKAAGSVVAWHVYPDTGHCWDCRQLDGRVKTDIRGQHISYKFSGDATRDSTTRLFAFLTGLGG